MSDSEDEKPAPFGVDFDYSDNDDDDDDDDVGPSTSWGARRRNKRPVISDSESDDDAVEINKDESCDSDSSGSSPGAETCAICLGRMRGEVASPNTCEHTFCEFCLLEWAKNNATCPQDRIPFTAVLVRKTFGAPVDKEVPIEKKEEKAEVIDLTGAENPTYCEVCNECNREERLLLCDGCDLGYHLECLDPPLSQVPVEEWFCPVCASPHVPDVLSNRRQPSSSRREREGRGTSSRSHRSSPPQQEPRRIPRTRATERIRAHIQKKKSKRKLKRRKYKESKKAKVASGELEDTRPAVVRLNEFSHFVEQDNDIDAAHSEDKYAEQLLAGAMGSSSRHPSLLKADAAKRLRDFAFTPQASYSGARVKNRVIEIVNTQSGSNDTDLLSGILENQAIAFSSSKKLVLTNERKLTKQPGLEVSCDIFQEENSFMSEPLPSQRKTPERNDPVECASSSDQLKPNAEDKTTAEHDQTASNSADGSHDGDRRSPHRSSYKHSSSYRKEWQKDYSSGSHSSHSYHRYHSSSWRNGNHHETSSSSYSNDRRQKSSHNCNRDRDQKEHNGRYEKHGSSERRDKSHRHRDRSLHNRNRSVERERKERKYSPSSSKHSRSHGYRSHSSQSLKSYSKGKGSSSQSLTSGNKYVRSQWSFNYFNSDNLFSKSSGIHSHPVASSSSPHEENKTQDSKGSAIEGDVQEAESDAGTTSNDGRGTSGYETELFTKNKSVLGTDNLSYVVVSPHTYEKEHKGSAIEESNVKTNQVSQKDTVNSSKTAKSDKKNFELSSHKEQSRKEMIPRDEIIETDELTCGNIQSHNVDDIPVMNFESKSADKGLFKSSGGKKTKMAALFGDVDNGGRKKEQREEEKKKKEKEITKVTKKAKNSKTDLFGCDSDDDDNVLNTMQHRDCEFARLKDDSNSSQKPDDKNINGSFRSDSKEELGGSGKNKSEQSWSLDVCEKKTHDSKKSSINLSSTKDEKFSLSKKGEKSNGKHNTENGINKEIDNKDNSKIKRKPDYKSSNKKKLDELKAKLGHKNSDACNTNSLSSHGSNGTIHRETDITPHHNSAPDKSTPKEDDLRKDSKVDPKHSHSKHGRKEKLGDNLEGGYKKGSVVNDLFGDIDDIGSSSNSNFSGIPLKDKQDSNAFTDVEKSKDIFTTFEGKISEWKETRDKITKEERSHKSDIREHARNEEMENAVDTKGLSSLRCFSTTKVQLGPEFRQNDSENRMKQQKAVLEAKVVQEVKKSLNPYYRNKSITKDEYKQIVAKCVKKVVTAESGDDIDPEKMHDLVMGYIKVYKHRHMKSHT